MGNLLKVMEEVICRINPGNSDIWVIGSRRLMPIENCRGFPKMVSVLALRVTSIFIGFTNRFFLLFTDSPCAAPM